MMHLVLSSLLWSDALSTLESWVSVATSCSVGVLAFVNAASQVHLVAFSAKAKIRVLCFTKTLQQTHLKLSCHLQSAWTRRMPMSGEFWFGVSGHHRQCFPWTKVTRSQVPAHHLPALFSLFSILCFVCLQ
jgi:hypothetical protein